MPENPPELDWVHLPADALVESLGASLHDGKLLAIRSDLREGTVLLEIDVPYLRKFHHLGEEVRFWVTLNAVESARVSTFIAWPGPRTNASSLSVEEQNRQIAEYPSKWREQSLDWEAFMATFPANYLDISTAEMSHNENTTAIQLQGELIGEDIEEVYCRVFLRARNMQIQQSNGPLLTREQFIQLGEDYWNAWSARAVV